MNLEDSTWRRRFRNADNTTVDAISISLDLRYVAIARRNETWKFLEVYDTFAGWDALVGVGEITSALWFAPDERDIWCGYGGGAKRFTITHNALNHTQTVDYNKDATFVCPWRSLCGYKIMRQRWILDRDGKRLLILPTLWQSHDVGRAWNGKFLILLHAGLLEPVILELEP